MEASLRKSSTASPSPSWSSDKRMYRMRTGGIVNLRRDELGVHIQGCPKPVWPDYKNTGVVMYGQAFWCS